MQGQDTPKQNVVSLFANREKTESDAQNAQGETPAALESFGDVMSRNEKNKERVAKERANANKSVLRSYRIKH